MEIKDTQYPYYPNINVSLDGTYGNASEIIFRVTNELASNGVPDKEIREFVKEATQKDYVNLVQVCLRWVIVE